MILDALHVVDPCNTTLADCKQRQNVCILQIEVQDTMLEVLDVLHSQEKPFFLSLPLDGEALSCAEHFVTLGHFLAKHKQCPFLCLIIPPDRANVFALATLYGIQNAPSIEEALHAFESVVSSAQATTSHLFGLAQSRTEEQRKVEASSPQRMLKTQWPLLRGVRIALLLVISAIVLPLMLLVPTHLTSHVSARTSTIALPGTFSFESSGQFNPNLTQGYNDIVKLSLHPLPAPPKSLSYYAWLLPDPADDSTRPLLLGSLHQGSVNLTYTSPDHTNLLAFYSGVRITVQPANSPPETPSLNPKTWKWQGFIPNIPTPGDENHYSLLSHLRHLLAKDPTLQANKMPGGLVLWLTRNASKIDEWAGSAQGDWHGMQTSSGDADQIHRQMLRILEYLDGIFYYAFDVPPGSPWIVDPLAGKIGLLDRVTNQQPPAFLTHVDIHLTGLASAPGHTQQQQQLAILMNEVIARMTTDLQQIRSDAVVLVKMNTQQVRQSDNEAKLDEIANLASDVQSGWFDNQTGENIGGVLWITARLQQLTIMPIY